MVVNGNYDYASVIRLSYKFYEAQRAGELPDDDIPWRKSSFLDDGSDNGIDLVGGYFDAGDYVKFGFPMAFTTTVLAWGMIEYANAYDSAGLSEEGREQLRWATDYFIKAHPSEKKFFGQVGNGEIDHSYWGRPEDWPSTEERPSYFIDESSPGSDLAAETAAAMAASSMVFRGSDDTYADTLLSHARELYAFADENRGIYSDAITDASEFYGYGGCVRSQETLGVGKMSSGYEDELTWAAAWLYRATGETSYLNDAESKYVEFGQDGQPSEFSWDDKNAGVQVLLAEITGNEKYSVAVEAFCNYVINEAPRTPKGLVFIQDWGSLPNAANVVFICLLGADKLGLNQEAYRNFATQQIDYILGDTGFSYVIGFGTNYPLHPHHASSSCPTVDECGGCECDWSYFETPNPNPQILEGALIGGPDINDDFQDDRSDFNQNEVALDYNAAFQGALAGLIVSSQ
ncbi:unnamed protein product [Darwinula stevensoni]|uniref:Endoglucanase n=1 Tax=Darwinula stevensoni TaxID=69355 RepID=A0A7R8X6K1_9CRUS|nr:unnamed protein product [Darwinula stevensoni]CAG0886958.1 unnamed protein product [Darwinula stevensoni]